MRHGRSVSPSSDKLEHLLAFVAMNIILIGVYAGSILFARLLLALGWAA
ncbi:hypothetical protein ACFWAY_31380 [Rhodococcus sp. NPDC059968]